MTRWRDTVVVTGGAGFIGSALVERLVQLGERVVVIDNLANGKRSNLEHLPADRVSLIVADIRAPDSFRSELESAHTIFHLACLGVRHSLHAPRENHEVNATGTLILLEAAQAAGVPRLIHVSSSEVYGSAVTSPMNEDHPTRPTTVYGAGKLAGEAYARAFQTSYGLPVTIVRPFNAYGPRCHHEGDVGEVIPKFMLRAMAGRPLVVFGDGNQTRDFTFVDDIADGIAAAARCEGAIGQTINLGSGTATSVRDLAHIIAEVTGHESRIEHHAARPGDVANLCADSGLAAQLLGYRPAVLLRDGLARLAGWYRGLGVSPQQLLADEIEHNWLPRIPMRNVR